MGLRSRSTGFQPLIYVGLTGPIRIDWPDTKSFFRIDWSWPTLTFDLDRLFCFKSMIQIAPHHPNFEPLILDDRTVRFAPNVTNNWSRLPLREWATSSEQTRKRGYAFNLKLKKNTWLGQLLINEENCNGWMNYLDQDQFGTLKYFSVLV